MKKAIIITAVLTLLAGVGGAVWLKTRADAQNTVTAAQEQKQQQPVFSKYDIGPADAQEILELVNAERERIGVAPLVMDENVRMSAQLKADDMVARGYRQHELPEGGGIYTNEMRRLIYREAKCSFSGENFVYNAAGMTSQDAFNWWMNSESHRKAIQDPKYTKIGIGVTDRVAVQHFCQM